VRFLSRKRLRGETMIRFLLLTRVRSLATPLILVFSLLYVSDTQCQDSPKAVPQFKDEPAAHRRYDQMIDAMCQAQTLSYTSTYTSEVAGKFKRECTYQVWLKKPNYFRMETKAISGELGGVLIGDGGALWIHWPNGRPRWSNVEESAADEKTRLSSYMTKPTPQGKHSILHEALFLGGGMVFPILDASNFHGHVDSLKPYLTAVRGLETETIAGESCDKIEVSVADNQRRWELWLSQRDHLPRKLKEVVHVDEDHFTSEQWSSVVVNGEISESLFAWKPPSGWTEWKLPDPRDKLLQAGTRAPDFELASVNGSRIQLSAYRGRPVWLTFWRVGCPPCRVEMPFLQNLYTQNKDKGLVVVGINVADDKLILADYLREEGITFPNVHDTSEVGQKIFETYGAGAMPTNYLIDREGIIVDAWMGGFLEQPQWKAALQRVGMEVNNGDGR
jgi:peroxiredoxin/outer membrane lipoprotein-sorting protein